MCKPSNHDDEDDETTQLKFPPSTPRESSGGAKLRMTKNLAQRLWLMAFACLQNALAGGLVFGWASIDRTLLIAPPEQGGTGLTPRETTLIFSWASSVAMLSSLIMGLVLDKCGPRTASVVSHLLIGLGCQLFAVATSFEVLALATCLMAFGGPGISSSIVHIANLFPRNQFLVMSCLCGSITFSFSILAVFGDLWERYGTGFRALFGGYVAVIGVSTLGSFLLWPDLPFEKEDSDEYYRISSTPKTSNEEEAPTQQPATAEQEYVEATLSHHQLVEEPLNSGLRQNLAYGRTESYYQSTQALQTGNTAAVSLKDQPFWNQLFSSTYLRNLLIFVTTSFFVNFTIASLSTELADQQVFDLDAQHALSRSFTLIMSGGLIVSILVGWLMDRVGIEACTLLTLLLGQTSLALRMLGHTHSIMILGFGCYTLFRQFLFPVFIACLTARLGFKYFGILSGVGFALSGIAQLFMASLVRLLQGDCHLQDESVYGIQPCHAGGWNSFHILQMVLLGMLTLIPILDWMKAAKQPKPRGEVKIVEVEDRFDTQQESSESSSHSGFSVGPAPPSALLGHSFYAATYGSV